MDLATARRNLATTERAANTARARYNQLVTAASRRRRADPRIPAAKEASDAAEAAWRQAVDDYTKAQQRPRYTAPR